MLSPISSRKRTDVTEKRIANKTRVDGAKRRELILEAAREAFLAEGFSGARTRDIAERAGVTEALVYRHFASKKELFEEAILAPLDQWAASLPHYVTLTVGAPEAERRALTRVSNAQLLRATVQIMPLLGVVLFANGEDGRSFFLTRFLPLIERTAAESRAYGKGWTRPDLDMKVVAQAALGLYLLAAMEARFSGTEVDVEHVASQFVDLIYDGIMAAPPRKPGANRSPRRTKA
jgi:AcrR family transcriptional regulator